MQEKDNKIFELWDEIVKLREKMSNLNFPEAQLLQGEIESLKLQI